MKNDANNQRLTNNSIDDFLIHREEIAFLIRILIVRICIRAKRKNSTPTLEAGMRLQITLTFQFK